MKSKFYPSKLSIVTTAVLTVMLATATLGHAASPASPSDLLEKGIYSEETKGDLDTAMNLYQQVITQAKQQQDVSAQAQYRLGVCYYKKKNYQEANNAFENLIKNFPDQKELVARARSYLGSAVALLPTPWKDGEELRMTIKLAGGMPIGLATYTIDSGETNGHALWRFGSRLFAGVQQLSRVEVEADSLKPLHSRWMHTLLGDADAVYLPNSVEVRLKGKDNVIKTDLSGVVYDNEEAVQLFRRLPLATNYTGSVKFLSSLASGAIVPVKLEVKGIEMVKVPAGSFECYKLDLSIRQTFWVSTDTNRYLVKFEAGGVMAELAAAAQRNPTAPVKFTDPQYHYTFTAPAGWLFDRHEAANPADATRTILLDPEGLGIGFCELRPLSSLKDDQRKSLRAWAESEVANAGRTFKDFKVNADSWTERAVMGQPGLSVTAEFIDGEQKQTAYAVFAFQGANAISFLLHASTQDFGALSHDFDGIIDSCAAK